MTSTETPARRVTAAALVIGNEILSGRTRDANLNHLAKRLTELGVDLKEARVVPDDRDVIVRHVNELRAAHDYVFTTGGIGPTHDDITAECVAAAMGQALIVNPTARALLAERYGDAELTQARLRMARTPEHATLIDNPVSVVPGFQVANVFVLAGIPDVMRAMFESIAHTLTGGQRLMSATIVAPLREGDIAEPLGAVQARYPEVEIGSYPFYSSVQFGASLVVRGTDRTLLEQVVAELRELVRTLGAEPVSEEFDFADSV
jgi:molybdenum cofactor synthesis domain-containing protein